MSRRPSTLALVWCLGLATALYGQTVEQTLQATSDAPTSVMFRIPAESAFGLLLGQPGWTMTTGSPGLTVSQVLEVPGVTLRIAADERVLLHAVLRDGRGQVATVPLPPVWTIADSARATLTAASDGLSATLSALSSGTTSVTVTAKTAPINGVSVTLTATISVEITPAQARTILITADAPEPQP